RFSRDWSSDVCSSDLSVESIWQNYRRLKNHKFDFIVNFSEEWSAACLSLLLNTKYYALKSLKWKQWLMVNLKIDQLPNKHLVEKIGRASCRERVDVAV